MACPWSAPEIYAAMIARSRRTSDHFWASALRLGSDHVHLVGTFGHGSPPSPSSISSSQAVTKRRPSNGPLDG